VDVFLDADVLYHDPFLNSIHGSELLSMAESGKLTLHMSSVVYEEILNNYQKELEKYFGEIKKAVHNLEKYNLLTDDVEQEVVIKHDIKYHLENLRQFYLNLIDYGVLNIIDYDNSFLPELVKRSLKRIKPFTEAKQEFRDGITWLSYVKYASDHGLEKCHFITNNKNDYCEKGELHPDLKRDSDKFLLYSSIREFVTNSEELSLLKQNLELERWVEEEEIDAGTVCAIIERHAFNQLHSECIFYVENTPTRIKHGFDVYDHTMIDAFGLTIHGVEDDIEIDVVNGSIIINGIIQVGINVDVQERNPLYEPGDEEYFFIGSAEVDLSVEFNLKIKRDYEFVDVEFTRIYQE
jgi:PIN domain